MCTFHLVSGQVQHKLNRIATASGSANASVAMSALLDVMADAHTKSAGRQKEPQEVGWLITASVFCSRLVFEICASHLRGTPFPGA